jgi:hypothetical protein
MKTSASKTVARPNQPERIARPASADARQRDIATMKITGRIPAAVTGALASVWFGVFVLLSSGGFVAASLSGMAFQQDALVYGFSMLSLHWGMRLLVQQSRLRRLQWAIWHMKGGILDKIDENRRLYDLLRREAPGFLNTHPGLGYQFDCHDNYLSSLADRVAKPLGLTSPFKPIPKPWPEVIQPCPMPKNDGQ